eukprot:m.198036 g.198036  ORF g.198036 m.198036 type:complete len:112 (+) comp25887_c1_seq2:156-491(+)
MYDLFIDVAGSSITIASHAKSAFGLGKVHKEIATAMTEMAGDDDSTDQDVVKDLVQRTKDIRAGLGKLAVPSEKNPDQYVVTLEAIQERKMAQSMKTFLYNLALAENLVEL